MKNNSAIRGRFCVDWKVSLILIIVFSFLVYVAMGCFSQTNTPEYFESCFNNPILFYFNFLPILLIMLMLYAVTAHSPFSIVVTSVAFLLPGAINNYKIIVRNDPFVFSDILLGKEAFVMLGSFDLKLMIIGIVAIILAIVLIIALLFFFRHSHIKIWVRLVILVGCLLVAALSFTAYKNYDIYDSLPVKGDAYCRSDQYASKGWVYCLIYELDKITVRAPKDYNPDDYKEREKDAADPAIYKDAVKPHVIMIMSEAFSDISENEHLSFDGYRDPLQNYKTIAADSLLSGHIAVDVVGGGTATTEFEVLTGIDIDSFNTYSNPYNLVRKDLQGLPSLFKSVGYNTEAIHPGDSWFYNRSNVYKYMKFDNFLTLGDGIDENAEKDGGYITDAATYDYMAKDMEKHLASSDNPLFQFCVTIQNHGPYEGKYGYPDLNFSSDIELSEASINELANYIYGVSDCDEQLGNYINYLEGLSEPVVVVYFGDHYPYFSNLYDEIGYGHQNKEGETSALDLYTTPFFIWQNSAAAATTPMADNLAATKLESDTLFNASYLGSTLMQLMGIEKLSPFLNFNNYLRKEIPVKSVVGYYDKNANSMDPLSSYEQQVDKDYSDWSYYKMFNK